MGKECLLDSEEALAQGRWVKLICGASNQDLPSITDLCALYATAGVHCVDVGADIAVVHAARQGLDWVESTSGRRPWLMVSISDGKEAHFRKAVFDPARCPIDCPRPCQRICPAEAIENTGGVNWDKCYGCGRCLSSCPLGLINEVDKHINSQDIGPLIQQLHPDAVEVHTAPGRVHAFQATINSVMEAKVAFKRIAVSCGLEGHKLTAHQLAKELWIRHSFLRQHNQKPIWQLDGRPMSGDIGAGVAKAAVALWQEMLPLAPPGPLQLAGGTNSQTIHYLPNGNRPAGIAFGGMARKVVQPWLIEAQKNQISLREWPAGWETALAQAKQLINPWLSIPDNC